jgi:hypothetical protein
MAKQLFSQFFQTPQQKLYKVIMAPDGGDDGGGGGGGGPAAPVFTSISASRLSITNGATITITASFTGYANVLAVSGNGVANGSVFVNGSPFSVTPISAGTQTYTFTATNSTTNVTATKTIAIEVLAQPVLSSFTAAASGNFVNLNGAWSPTSGITGIVSPGNIVLTSGVQTQIAKPSVTTTYRLTITNASGWGDYLESTVTIAVAANPVITSFVASANTIDSGVSFNLTAVFTGGTGVITRNFGNFSNSTQSISCTSNVAVPTNITANTRFTLTVTGT